MMPEDAPISDGTNPDAGIDHRQSAVLVDTLMALLEMRFGNVPQRVKDRISAITDVYEFCTIGYEVYRVKKIDDLHL